MYRIFIISRKVNFFLLSNKLDNFLVLNRLKFFAFFFISRWFILNKEFKILDFYVKNNRLSIQKLNFLFFSWSFFVVCKIKFRHKITWFRISRKYNQFIRFNLGLSHYNYVFFNTLRFYRKKKYLTYHNFLIWSNNASVLREITLFLKRLQPISAYTQRGFRFSRDAYVKRPGKASKYAHLKSKLF